MPVLDQFNLTGKVALVTGAGTALGHLIVVALAEAGADVVVAARDAGSVEQAVRDVQALGRRSLALGVDVTSEESVQTMVDRVLRELGRIDILVNGEEERFAKSLLDTSLEDFRRVLDASLVGTFLCTKAVGPHMLERGKGRVINLATGLSVRGLVNAAAYCAAKGAIFNFTQALALEWAAQGVTVNALGPGWFAEGPIDFEEERASSVLVRMIPQQRRGLPEDIAGLVVYLASDAADFISAQTVFVDGGMLTHP